MLPSAPLEPEGLEAVAAMRNWEDYFTIIRPRFAALVQECGCLPPHSRVLTEFLSRSLTLYKANPHPYWHPYITF